METYNPFVWEHVKIAGMNEHSVKVFKIVTEDPGCYAAAENYLRANGYQFGLWRCNGITVEGWKFVL